MGSGRSCMRLNTRFLLPNVLGAVHEGGLTCTSEEVSLKCSWNRELAMLPGNAASVRLYSSLLGVDMLYIDVARRGMMCQCLVQGCSCHCGKLITWSEAVFDDFAISVEVDADEIGTACLVFGMSRWESCLDAWYSEVVRSQAAQYLALLHLPRLHACDLASTKHSMLVFDTTSVQQLAFQRHP